MPGMSLHVVDVARGKPAQGMRVEIFRLQPQPERLASGQLAANGTLEDPIVVVDSKGKFLRSFGKGLNPMSHGIRFDPAGNLWTVDAHTSMVRKFTPEGALLMTLGTPGQASANTASAANSGPHFQVSNLEKVFEFCNMPKPH